MNVIVIILFCFIVLMGLIRDRSRILEFLIACILFIITCYSYDEFDYLLYTRIYETVGSGGIVSYEILYTLLMFVGNRLGLDYNGFRIVITIIELLLIYSTIYRYAGHSSMSWSLLFVFPGWILSTLMRHSLALSIIVFGIRFLIDDKDSKIRGSIFYVVCVILASLIHSSYWVFAAMLLIKFWEERRILTVATIFAIVLHVFGYTNFLFRIYSLLPIRAFTIEKYMTNNYSNMAGTLYQVIRQSIIVLWALYIREIYNKYKDRSESVNASDLFMENIVKINYASIFFVGIMYCAANASRMNHVIIMINCIATAISIRNVRRMTWNRFGIKAAALGLVFLFSILAGTIESSYLFDRVLKMIIETNTIINCFN